MDIKTCKNYQACPIYNGILKDKQTTSKHYKEKYCNSGVQGWQKCKRFLVKEKTGKCPPELLPNSFKTVDEIIQIMG